MSYKNIILDKKGDVATLTIHRPPMNALDSETIHELHRAVDELEQDKAIKVVILTGEGKTFIAGADIKQMKEMTPLAAKEFAELGHTFLMKIERSRLPYIAVVNGFALGGGCEVMMACDIILASEIAKIGQPEINLGIHPGFGGTQRLPRLVGKTKAKELLLTGETISAEESLRIGLVNKLVRPDVLMDEAMKLAQQIAGKSSVQTGLIKSLVNTGVENDLASACALEIPRFSSSFSTDDQKEGMSAFLEKRKPVFKGK